MAQLKRQQTELLFSLTERRGEVCEVSNGRAFTHLDLNVFSVSARGLYIQAESNLYLYSHKTLSPGKSEKEFIWKLFPRFNSWLIYIHRFVLKKCFVHKQHWKPQEVAGVDGGCTKHTNQSKPNGCSPLTLLIGS